MRAAIRRWGLVVAGIAVMGCAASCAREIAPAALDPANTQCGFCRMAVSDVRFAAQIVAPGAEPIFFDDIGCLRDYLARDGARVPADAVAFVADHATRAWVRAADAVYTRAARVDTPMGSGMLAHATEDSRRQDVDTAAGSRLTVAAVFGNAGPPDGGRR